MDAPGATPHTAGMSARPERSYGEREYVRDALTAFRHQLRWERRTYWPEYHGIEVAWTWRRVLGTAGSAAGYVVLGWCVLRLISR